MKVTFVLPNLESGGTEGQVLALGRLIDRSRFSPSLITTAGGGALFREFAALMPVMILGGVPEAGRRFRTSPREHLTTLGWLHRILRRFRPDVLHAFLPAANVLGPLAARRACVPKVIVSKRALAEYKTAYPLIRRLEPVGNLLASCILVNSDAVRRDVERTERFWRGKIRVLRNGVAPMAPWPAEERARFRLGEKIPPGVPVVLSLSNFYPYKGIPDLIRAAAKVAAARPEALFLLVGRDAGTETECRALAAELGLAGNVRFLGSRADVPDLIRAADLFVHPSHEEGLSNAILEAMAGGLAVVACDVGGNPEAVSDGKTGLLVPPRSPGALGDAILGLMADPARRAAMGEAGRRRADEAFSLERMVRETEAVYESLVAARR